MTWSGKLANEVVTISPSAKADGKAQESSNALSQSVAYIPQNVTPSVTNSIHASDHDTHCKRLLTLGKWCPFVYRPGGKEFSVPPQLLYIHRCFGMTWEHCKTITVEKGNDCKNGIEDICKVARRGKRSGHRIRCR